MKNRAERAVLLALVCALLLAAWPVGGLGEAAAADYAAAIDGLEVGQTSAPVLIDDSWHVFRVQAREAVRVPNLADDWDEIEQYARSQRMQARMQSFVEKWRKEIHVDIRDPELRR